MNGISLTGDDHMNATILSNIFVDNYMKDANDAQIKVYLYLLRMLQAHRSVDISDIADQFNHTEKDVIRALRYWEKVQVLSLEFAPDRTITGIRLLDLKEHAARPAEEPAAMSAVSHQTVSSAASFEKPAYTPDELKAFGQQENAAQLFFIAEQYLGRPLTPSDMKSILFFTDRLHFSDDLIDYLLQYCVERGKKDFRYIDKVAIGWAESGITTPAQARRHASRYDKNVYSIMNALGKSNAPTKTEVAYIQRWSSEYGFELDIILEACGRTVLATDKHRFAYADRILLAWHKAGVHHVSDIAGLDTTHRKEQASPPARSGSATEYNNFMHSSYDFDVLERELLNTTV